MSTTQDWANLANTIRGVGQDYYTSTMGIAKFLDEQRMNDLKAQESQLDIAAKRVKLNEAQLQERELSRPFTVDDVANLIGPSGSVEKQIEYMSQGEKVLGSMGYTLQDNGTYLSREGNTLDRRTIKNVLPALMSTVVASIDDKLAFKGSVEADQLKARMINENPNLTDDEKTSAIAQIAVTVKQKQQSYDELTQNKTLRAGLVNQDRIIQKMSALTEAAGIFTAYGSPETVKIIDEQYKVLAEQLKESNMSNLKLQGYVPVSDKTAKQLGLPQGMYVPPETMASLAHTVGSLQAVAMRNKQELTEAAKARALTAILTQTDNQVKQVMSTLPKDVSGNYIYKVKDKFGKDTGDTAAYTAAELADMHSKLYNKFWSDNVSRLGMPSMKGQATPQATEPSSNLLDLKQKVLELGKLAESLPRRDRKALEGEFIMLKNSNSPDLLQKLTDLQKKYTPNKPAPVGGLTSITDINDYAGIPQMP